MFNSLAKIQALHCTAYTNYHFFHVSNQTLFCLFKDLPIRAVTGQLKYPFNCDLLFEKRTRPINCCCIPVLSSKNVDRSEMKMLNFSHSLGCLYVSFLSNVLIYGGISTAEMRSRRVKRIGCEKKFRKIQKGKNAAKKCCILYIKHLCTSTVYVYCGSNAVSKRRIRA